MSIAHRLEDAPELLDRPGQDARQLEVSLNHVAQVNHWLGGTRSLIRTLARLLPAGGSIIDLATGNAAVPIAVVRWARRNRVPLTVHATDVHPQMLEIAAGNCAGYPEIIVESADALRLPYRAGSFSIAIMTLALHHFEGPDLQRALREAARVSQRAIVISELERGWPNYLGARLLSRTLWRNDPLTRHDGPLSVLRSFTRAELMQHAHAAGLHHVRVRRYFYYRLVLVAEF
jgi:ubiquinone/menaquinone biosynthesis C-methylase UbiE